MKAWGKKGPGIVALMASNLKDATAKTALGISKHSGSIAKGKDFKSQLKVWKHILKAKYTHNEDARELLVSTAPYQLVERARFNRESNYWGAFHDLENGVFVGQNMMGKLMQYVRDKYFVPGAQVAEYANGDRKRSGSQP